MGVMKRIPKVRFPEFEGEWDEKKGRELFNNKRKKGQSHLPIYSVTQDQGLVSRDSLQRHMGNNASDEANLQANPGDLVYNMMRMWQGAVGICHQDCMVSPAYVILEPRNVNSEFFIQLLKNDRYLYFLNVFSQGITSDRLRLYFRDFIQIKFNLPTLPEQQKISTFLTTIDTRIQQLSRKKALLEQYKKGVTQQIFSQEIRFKDEDGKEFPAWEEKKLGVLTYKVGRKNKQGAILPIYSINNKEGFLPQSDQFDGVDSNERGYDISLYKVVNANTFAYNPARINVGSIGYSGNLNEVIISSLYVCFKTKDSLDDQFLLSYLNTFEFNKAVLRNAEGGVRSYLFYENFSKIKIPLPSLPEQQKIVVFLSIIDGQINLATQQLNRMQAFKKGLLQQLFV